MWERSNHVQCLISAAAHCVPANEQAPGHIEYHYGRKPTYEQTGQMPRSDPAAYLAAQEYRREQPEILVKVVQLADVTELDDLPDQPGNGVGQNEQAAGRRYGARRTPMKDMQQGGQKDTAADADQPCEQSNRRTYRQATRPPSSCRGGAG